MTPGTVVTYICRDYEHTALVIEFDSVTNMAKLVHVMSGNDGGYVHFRSLPQVEVEVPRDVPDVEGRFFREGE